MQLPFDLERHSLGSAAALNFDASANNGAEIAFGVVGIGISALPGLVDTAGSQSISLTAVPEPSCMAMTVLGGGAVLAWRKRRRSAAARQ